MTETRLHIKGPPASAVQQPQRSPKPLITPTSKKSTLRSPPPVTHLLLVAQDATTQGWLRRAGYPWPGSEMWVLQGAIWPWTRDVSSVLLSFSSPSSPRAPFRQALPSPLLQPPPLSLRLYHQTKHHLSGKRLPEAALLEQMPPCPPASRHCHIRLPGAPHTRTDVTLPAWVCCPRCRMGVTEPYLPSYIPAPRPTSTPGLLCGRRSRSQHLGCPVTPPTLGVAGRCCCPRGVCTAVRASRMDLLSLLTIPIPRATAELLPAGRNPEPLEAEAATPCDPVHTGDDAD